MLLNFNVNFNSYYVVWCLKTSTVDRWEVECCIPASKLYLTNTCNCSTRMQTRSWEVPIKYKGGPKFPTKGHKIIGSIKAIDMVNRGLL